LLRVATAYFGILSARINSRPTGARAGLWHFAQPGQDSRADRDQPAQRCAQAQAFYDRPSKSVIDAQNTLDDAELLMTEIVGPHSADIAALIDEIPLTSPDPARSMHGSLKPNRTTHSTRRGAAGAGAGSRDSGAAWQGIADSEPQCQHCSHLAESGLRWQSILDAAGVSFNWPLFQGGAVSSAVRQSRALYRQAQALYDTAQRDTERLTRAAYRGVVTGISRIGAAKHAVESARESVEASQRNVEFGTGSVFDLLNAQNNYYAYNVLTVRRDTTT